MFDCYKIIGIVLMLLWGSASLGVGISFGGWKFWKIPRWLMIISLTMYCIWFLSNIVIITGWAIGKSFN